ncbi:hypothetical protein AXG93_3873s1190 [Marchantia polymorpha subsp. ruderalis]|uniref:Uncharacterized protein n=1 Tax=Marchantia polymorpha subsp. ruderalis TaxID=1480154 RepID=A0A176VJR6_MARPO|nr:hypothetical protein AXG93_3873s1190 [Marchantia polymorpha subsp. ruderalis]
MISLAVRRIYGTGQSLRWDDESTKGITVENPDLQGRRIWSSQRGHEHSDCPIENSGTGWMADAEEVCRIEQTTQASAADDHAGDWKRTVAAAGQDQRRGSEGEGTARTGAGQRGLRREDPTLQERAAWWTTTCTSEIQRISVRTTDPTVGFPSGAPTRLKGGVTSGPLNEHSRAREIWCGRMALTELQFSMILFPDMREQLQWPPLGASESRRVDLSRAEKRQSRVFQADFASTVALGIRDRSCSFVLQNSSLMVSLNELFYGGPGPDWIVGPPPEPRIVNPGNDDGEPQ